MSLCPKCAEAVNSFGGHGEDSILVEATVPESECEFWVHKELNAKMRALDRIAAAVGGKDKLEALVMGEMLRKEIGL